MKKTTPLFLTLMFLSAIVFGQDYTFKVLVNKGQNQVKDGADWKPIKVGATLQSVDELKISQNAYLGLIHATGKPLEVKEAGRYSVADLSAKVSKGTSVLNKYTDFILSNNESRTNLNATGAVHRALGEIWLHLPPNSGFVLRDTVSIDWETAEKIEGPYVVTFTSIFGVVLKTIETPEKSVTINISDEKFARENNINVKVMSKTQKTESEQHMLKKLSGVDKETLQASYAEVAALLSANTALNRLIKAGFFEENDLLTDAATAYQQAIKLAPEVVSFREDYENFLLRNGLKPVPRK